MIKSRIDKYKFFSFSGKYSSWVISDNILNVLKELKFKYIDGSYLEKNLINKPTEKTEVKAETKEEPKVEAKKEPEQNK